MPRSVYLNKRIVTLNFAIAPMISDKSALVGFPDASNAVLIAVSGPIKSTPGASNAKKGALKAALPSSNITESTSRENDANNIAAGTEIRQVNDIEVLRCLE